MKKNSKVITLTLLVLLVIGVVIFLFTQKEKEAPATSATPTVIDTRCYGTRDTVGEDEYNYNLVSIDFFNSGEVEVRFDYKDGETESSGILEGIYSRENNYVMGIYDFYTDSNLYSEERIISFNESGLIFGFGEMYKDDSGILRYKDTSTVTFDYPLPMVSCQRYDVWKREYNKTANTTGIITTD